MLERKMKKKSHLHVSIIRMLNILFDRAELNIDFLYKKKLLFFNF